jgi:hypothetical protein
MPNAPISVIQQIVDGEFDLYEYNDTFGEPVSEMYLEEFLLLSGFFFTFWVLLAFIIHMSFTICEVEVYTLKSKDKKLEYVSWWMAIAHSLIVPWMCSYYMLFSCESGMTLMDQQCRDNPQKFGALCMIVSLGYMISDFFLLAVFTTKMTMRHMQMAGHHFFVSYGLVGGLSVQGDVITIGIMMLIFEFTSFWCKGKFLLREHQASPTV